MGGVVVECALFDLTFLATVYFATYSSDGRCKSKLRRGALVSRVALTGMRGKGLALTTSISCVSSLVRYGVMPRRPAGEGMD